MFTLSFLCVSSPWGPSPSQPTPTKASSGGSVQRWGFSPLSMALAFPAKLCAFLLQLSEKLTKGEMQPCRSNILIIYCSVAHVAGHHHLERSSGPEEELSFSLWRTVLFNLIFPLSSHVISHGFRYVGREEWGGGGKWQILHFFCRDLGVWNVIISPECHYLIHFIYVTYTSWDKFELHGILPVASASVGPLASSPVFPLVWSKWSFLMH